MIEFNQPPVFAHREGEGLHYSFFTRKDYVAVQSDIVDYMARYLDADDCIRLEIALNEAVNNSFRYAFSVQVQLYADWSRERLVIHVRDDGHGYDAKRRATEVTWKRERMMEEHTLDESGRGLYMMANLVDMLYLNEVGNEIWMIKHLNNVEGTAHGQ